MTGTKAKPAPIDGMAPADRGPRAGCCGDPHPHSAYWCSRLPGHPVPHKHGGYIWLSAADAERLELPADLSNAAAVLSPSLMRQVEGLTVYDLVTDLLESAHFLLDAVCTAGNDRGVTAASIEDAVRANRDRRNELLGHLHDDERLP